MSREYFRPGLVCTKSISDMGVSFHRDSRGFVRVKYLNAGGNIDDNITAADTSTILVYNILKNHRHEFFFRLIVARQTE